MIDRAKEILNLHPRNFELTCKLLDAVIQCYDFDLKSILSFEIQMFKYLFSYMSFSNQTSLSCSHLVGL